MRTLRPFGLAVAVFLVVAAPATADDLAPRRDAAERARAQVLAKLETSERGLRARVRALYKLSAFGDLPHWVDGAAREGTLHRRGAARRVIVRDLEERRLLRAELAALDADLVRLDREAARARELGAEMPRQGSFVPPVDGRVTARFGPYTDPHTHVRLLRRGLELAPEGPAVVAPAAGQVLYAGPLRNLRAAVVLDHGQGIVTVTAGLDEAGVSRGDLVEAGAPVGRVTGRRVSFEVRRAGRSIDPYPLLRAPRQL